MAKNTMTLKLDKQFTITKAKLRRIKLRDWTTLLDLYGRKGVDLLSKNTPRDSGETSKSWSYTIGKTGKDSYEIVWSNSNVKSGYFNVALGIQYGHGTRGGGYVEGIDYINPSIQKAFADMVTALWREVSYLL